jgi:hypothetical protein
MASWHESVPGGISSCCWKGPKATPRPSQSGRRLIDSWCLLASGLGQAYTNDPAQHRTLRPAAYVTPVRAHERECPAAGLSCFSYEQRKTTLPHAQDFAFTVIMAASGRAKHRKCSEFGLRAYFPIGFNGTDTDTDRKTDTEPNPADWRPRGRAAEQSDSKCGKLRRDPLATLFLRFLAGKPDCDV